MTLDDVISNVADQDRGRLLEIADPWTGEPTGMKFWIAGPDSDTQRRAKVQMMDELADAAGPDGTVSFEHRETARINSLAKCVLRFEIEQDGKPIPYNHKNVVRVLKAANWLQAQVDSFAGDIRNFAPEKA